MKELSLNILDITENSTRAGATLVELTVDEQPADDRLTITVADNGRGMDAELLAAVCDPFTTTRTTRKIGLGIPLFKEAAESSGGSLSISSEPGVGTTVTAVFGYSHIDRMPLGDMAGTVSTIIQCHEAECDFVYRHVFGRGEFTLDTRELREVMEDVPLSTPEVVFWIKENIEENLRELYGGNKYENN